MRSVTTCPPASSTGTSSILDVHVAFGVEAMDGDVLKLVAVDGIGNDVGAVASEQLFLLIGFRRDRDAQEHGHCILVRPVGCGRLAASVLQMAILAATGVIERAEAVGRLCRGRCCNPKAAENRVADLEAGLALEADAVGEVRKRVAIVDAVPRGRRCPRADPRRARRARVRPEASGWLLRCRSRRGPRPRGPRRRMPRSSGKRAGTQTYSIPQLRRGGWPWSLGQRSLAAQACLAKKRASPAFGNAP